MAGRTLIVKIVGDERDLLRAFQKSSAAAGKFNADMTRTGKATQQAQAGIKGLGLGTVAATSGVLAFGAAVKASFAELFEAQKVTAQTGAVLKSTGGVANVTADQVERLAQELLNLSGVDDEASKRGENLLLTFTNVRNEVGAGNDIFNQATRAALDMSVAMGGDLQSAVLRIGKALQDPVRGMTALRRVGVQFSDAQVRQVKALVASGKQLEAQKVILRELQVEFGGSAKAAGETLPGQFAKLRENSKNLGADLAGVLLPALVDVTTALTRFSKALKDLKNSSSPTAFAKNVGEGLSSKELLKYIVLGPFFDTIAAKFGLGGKNAGEEFAKEFGREFQKKIRDLAITLPPINTAGAQGIVAFFKKNLRQPGTNTPFLDFQQANAEATKQLQDDLEVIRRKIDVLRGRLARAGTLKAKTEIQNQINDAVRAEQAILKTLRDQVTARKEARREAKREADEAEKRAKAKAAAARKAAREAAQEAARQLSAATDQARQEIGTLFQGPVVAPTDFQRKQALGVGSPGAGGLLADIRAQTAQAIKFENELKKLRALGVGTKTIDELRGLGTAAMPQIEAILRAPRGQQRQLIQALAARESAARRIGRVLLQAQTVEIDKIVVPVRVDIDGKKVAEVVTTHQQKKGKAMPKSRSGRNAGQG